MKKLILILIALAIPALANQAVGGFCEQGNTTVQTAGLPSTTVVQGSFPSCTVSVFTAGTSNLITIFADNVNTPLSNPFTANSSGRWIFYTANNQRVDIQLSGGGLPAPWKITDVLVNDLNGGVIAPSNLNNIRIVDGVRFAQTAAGINAADADLGSATGEVWLPSPSINATDAQISIRAAHTLRVFGTLTIDATASHGPILLGQGAGMVCSVNGGGGITQGTAGTIPSMVRTNAQDGSQNKGFWVEGCLFNANGSTVTNGVIDVTGSVNFGMVRDNEVCCAVSGWGIFAQDVQSGALGGTNNVQILNNRLSGTGTFGCIEILHSSTNNVILSRFEIQDLNCQPGSTVGASVLIQNLSPGAGNLRDINLLNVNVTNPPAGTSAITFAGVQHGTMKHIGCQGGGLNCVQIANNATNLAIVVENVECTSCSNAFNDAANNYTDSNNYLSHYDFIGTVNGYAGTNVFAAPVLTGNFNNIRIVDGVKFAQSAAGINAADADLGTGNIGEIWVPSPSVLATDAQISITSGHALRVFGLLRIDAQAKGPILLGSGSALICSHVSPSNATAIFNQTASQTISSMVRLIAQDGSQSFNSISGCQFTANSATVINGVIDASGFTSQGWIRDNVINQFNSGWGIFIQDIQSGALGGTNNLQIMNNQIAANSSAGCIEITHSSTNAVLLSGFEIQDNICSGGSSMTTGAVVFQNLNLAANSLRYITVTNLTAANSTANQPSLTINGAILVTLSNLICVGSGTSTCINIPSNVTNSGIVVNNAFTFTNTTMLSDVQNSVTIAGNLLAHYEFPSNATTYSFLPAVSYLKVNGLIPSATGTGFGTGPTFTMNTGSTNNAGLITITTGTTPASSGTLSLNFNTTQSAFGVNPPACVWTLEDSSGSWAQTAGVHINNTTTSQNQISWFNGGANLTASVNYQIDYWCAAK